MIFPFFLIPLFISIYILAKTSKEIRKEADSAKNFEKRMEILHRATNYEAISFVIIILAFIGLLADIFRFLL